MTGVAYFMVSLDDPEKNDEFAKSVGANFVLLSDPDKEDADRYGVLAFGGLYAKRITFYIDKAGVVRKIDDAVNPETAGPDVVRALRELDLGKTATPNPDAQ